MFDLMTFKVVPGQLDDFEKSFYELINTTHCVDRLAGAWRTEIGELNQAVHLWSAECLDPDNNQTQLCDYSKLDDYITERQTRKITIPDPLSKYITSANVDSLSEIRIYRYKRKVIDEVIEKWSLKIKDRISLSPIQICGYTDTYPISEWIHIWPYQDLNERQEIRQKAIQQKIWPPGAFKGLISQENNILIPAKFSPIKLS